MKKNFLLIKQNLLSALKSKIQFIVLFVLLFLSSLIIALFSSTIDRLNKANAFLDPTSAEYDYSYAFESRDTNKANLQSFTPLFALSDNYVSYNDLQDHVFSFPTLTIGGKDSALRALTTSDYLITVDSTNHAILTWTSKNQFYNFNYNGANFKNSLIGQLYSKAKASFDGAYQQEVNASIANYLLFLTHTKITDNINQMLTGLINYNLNKAVNPWTKDNVNAKFKDWVNYNGTSAQWNQHIDINHPTNIAVIKEDQTKAKPIISNDFFEQGLNGNLGSVYQYEYYDNGSGNWKKGYSYFYGGSILTSTQFKDPSAPENYGSLTIGSLYDSSYYLFNSSFRGHTNLEFFQLYNKLLGLNAGFNVFDRREFITWDTKNNVKFKLVDKNSVNLKIFRALPSYNPNFWRYVVITPGYAKKHHLQLGDHISVNNYQQDQDLVIGAFGSDSQNGYPTIYDVDVLPNANSEATIYVTSDVFANDKLGNPTTTSETSRVFLKAIANNSNINLFQQHFTDEYNNILKNYLGIKNNTPVASQLKIQSKDEGPKIYNRYQMLGNVIHIFTIVTTAIIIFFGVIVLFALWIIIKKQIEKEKNKIGILKSLGYNQVQIALAYSFYPLIPIIVGVIFGWVIGLVLQIPIIGVFSNFFTLPNQFNAYYQSLFYSLLGFLVLCSLVCFFISLRMISINTLDLINFNKNLRPNSLILKLRANLPLKRFNTKFKFSIAAVSVKKIVMIFGTMLIATFAITMAIALPVTGSSIVRDYYKYWNFKNETDYEAPIPNSPITRYDVYQWQGVGHGNSIDYPLANNGVIPKYYHSIGNPAWRETSKINTNEYDPTIDKGGNYPSELINMLGYNLLAFRGANISIGSLQKILDDYRDPTTGKPDDQIQFMVDNVACTVLPKIAGINHSLVGDWKSCIQQTVSALAPAYLMEYWNKSVERQNEFTIAAQTVPYDQANDEFFTKFTSTVQLNNQAVGIATYGINPNSRMITFNKDLLQQDKYQNNTIPILINQAFEKRYNYRVNDIIRAQPNVDILTYTNTLGQAVPIDPTWWVYNDTLDNDQGIDSYDPSKDIPLDQIDFSHLSYGNSDLVKYNGVTNPSRYTALEYGYYDPTYTDSSGNHVRPYYLMKNILLKLPATGVNGIDLNKVIVNDKNPSGNPFPSLIDGKYGVVRTRDNSYVIRPFDWNYSVIAITSVQQVFGDAGIPTQWYTEAFKTGLLKIANANDLASNPYQKKVNYQVVGVQNSYEKPLIYLNQNIANQLLGYATTYHQDLGIPTYFNGKFTLDSEPTDQTTRLGLASITGGYDINNFNDNFNWMVKDNNMISTKIDILDRVALIALMLGIAFILIIIFAAIAIVTMITNLFVNQFSKMMALLRIQGYTNREINSFTLGLFTPIVVIALILGFVAGWFAIVGGINIFENAHLLVLPYSFTWYLIIIVLCTIAIIYLVTYLLSAHSLRKMHIQEQVSLLDE